MWIVDRYGGYNYLKFIEIFRRKFIVFGAVTAVSWNKWYWRILNSLASPRAGLWEGAIALTRVDVTLDNS